MEYGDPPQPYRPPTKLDRCTDWLEGTLRAAGKPLRPAEIKELAREAGFGRTMLYEARALLGDRIEDTQGRRHPGNEWQLKAEARDEG